MREELPALRAGGYRRVKVPGHDEVFAFLRDAGAAGRALVVVNFGRAARLRLELPAPEGAPLDWDALASRPVEARAGRVGTELDMGAESAVVLVPRPSAR